MNENDELTKMWKEKIWLTLQYCLRVYLAGLRKMMENVKKVGLWVEKKKC
jgi:hypothetical protein